MYKTGSLFVPRKSHINWVNIKLLLKDTRYHFIGYLFAVGVPEGGVLGTTLLIITERTMSQENEQEDNVGVRHEVLKSSWNSPEEGQKQFGNVMEVSGNTPPSRSQQDTLSLLPRLQHILRSDDLCWLSPDQGLPIRISDILLLFVSQEVDSYWHHAQEQDYCRKGTP